MDENVFEAQQHEIIKMNSGGDLPMALKKVTIYGERCSGTNYLEQLLITNFYVEIVWDYGWKHFFGFDDLSGTDDVLFVGIVRNLPDWINSFYREKHHVPYHLRYDINSFLNDKFFSVHDDGTIINEDLNIETHKIYKNIFELRHVKNKFLVETMPMLVKNYKLITHDNLVNDFAYVMNQLKDCGLVAKPGFPENIGNYKGDKNNNVMFVKQPNLIPDEIIINKANLFYEKLLFIPANSDSK